MSCVFSTRINKAIRVCFWCLEGYHEVNGEGLKIDFVM